MIKAGLLVGCILGIAACTTQSSLNITRALFGYVEPPQAETVMQSLRKEYERCMNIDSSRNCSQLAYDRVRVSQGLDPKPLPTGYVRIIREEFNEPEPSQTQPSQQEPEQDNP